MLQITNFSKLHEAFVLTAALQTTAKKLKIKEEKIIVTVDKHANTSSASIPVAMTTAIKENKIKRGDMCLLEAFGAGFTWGAVLLRY